MSKLFGGKSEIVRIHVSSDTVAIYMKKPKHFEAKLRPGMVCQNI